MSLPEYLQERLAATVQQHMDDVLALAEQLSRQRLTVDAQACLTGVAEAALGVRRLMDTALDLKTAAEGLALQPAALRLNDLIDEIQARWLARAAQSGVTLLVSYDGAPEACVQGDRVRLLQIFDGFIGEALSSVRQGAVEIGLRAKPAAGGFALEGWVRGARGLASGQQALEDRIHDIDARFGLDVAMGMLLARRVLKGLGGELHNEFSNSGGETTVFRLILPAATAAPVERAGPSRSAHILVVDDNATNRIVAQALLEMFDCTCESAEDGVEAVEAAQTDRFDLILMDIKMPRLDGVAATRQIRALPEPLCRIPVIALTANADADDVQAYLAAGMNGVVEKPMKPDTLLAAIQKALAEPEAAAA